MNYSRMMISSLQLIHTEHNSYSSPLEKEFMASDLSAGWGLPLQQTQPTHWNQQERNMSGLQEQDL